MTLLCTVIGTLSKDPIGTETYTTWKVRCFNHEVTIFTNDNSADSRVNFRAGARIRGEGKGTWNEFNEEFSLTLNGGAIDSSDEDEDNAKIKVDGSIGHELNIEHDDEDEGGGQYIPVEIEANVRKRVSGNWGDAIDYVRAMILGPAVDKLMDFEKKGVTNLCFSGDLSLDAEYIKGQPAFYAEIDNVDVSKGRTGDDDAFWSSKPRGLANRKSGPKRVATPARTGGAPKKPKKTSGGGPDDPLPF
jgi:hypothetical protein